MDVFKQVITNPWVLGGWAVLAAACAVIVAYDLFVRNRHIMPLMKAVWIFATVYSGPLGLAVYWFSGRRQITRDTVWRRGFRSTAHCYSGCGFGEIVGVLISVGLFSLGNIWTAVVTFALAYISGFLLTVGPLMQEGVGLRQALRDAFLSESPSIVVMEVVAIGVDLWLAGSAGMGDPIFWASLVVSLSAGFLAAYPVNWALVHWGVKEGMMDPRDTGGSGDDEPSEAPTTAGSRSSRDSGQRTVPQPQGGGS